MDRAMHSSMCANTASTASSGSGSGARTSCTTADTCRSNSWAAASVRSWSIPAGLKSQAVTLNPWRAYIPR
ncbi:hypothetical protein GCM10022206_09420 [Streptomyces chiangmaiensis]